MSFISVSDAASPGQHLYQSPQQNIKTKLQFSSAKHSGLQRPLLNQHNLGHAPGSSAMKGPYQSKIGEYHMSRQNPNVLDQICSPGTRPTNQDLRAKEGRGWHQEGTGETPKATPMSWRWNEYTPLPRQSSYLHQVLKHRSRSSSPSSLVQLATRNTPGRLLKHGIGASPVTVRLAGVKKQESKLTEAKTDSERQRADPCDKETVLSALRQRRKRWASTPPEEMASSPSTSTIVSPPMSKRFRKEDQVETSHPPTGVPTTRDRKRSSDATPATPVPAVKKSKNSGRTGPTNVLSLSDADLEEEDEAERTPHVVTQPSPAASVVNRGSNERVSPAPLTLLDEEEIDRKRDESLGTLKAIFSSPHEAEKKDTTRRKLPIFCSTGTKPHLPSLLSATHSVTQEDLKKDREAVAAKLKAFLEADDETDGINVTNPSSETTSHPDAKFESGPANVGVVSAASAPAGLKLASASLNVIPAPTLATLPGPATESVSSSDAPQASSASDPVIKSSSTKTVSFAPLPNPGLSAPSNPLPTLSSLTSSTLASTSQHATIATTLPSSNQLQALSGESAPKLQIGLSASVPTSQTPAVSQSSVIANTSLLAASQQPTVSQPPPLAAPLTSQSLTGSVSSQPSTSSQPAPQGSSTAISFQAPPPYSSQPSTQTAVSSASTGLAGSMFKVSQMSTTTTALNPSLLGQASQLSTVTTKPSFSLTASQTTSLSQVVPASQQGVQAPLTFGQAPAGQLAPQLSLFGKASVPKTQPSLQVQNTMSSAQSTQPSGSSTKLTSQSLNFNFSAGGSQSISVKATNSGGPALLPGLKTATANSSQGGSTGPALFGVVQTTQGGPTLFGGASATGGNTQGGPTLFGGMSAAGGSTQGGPTFFGGVSAAGGSIQGGSALFGGVSAAGGSTQGGPVLFGQVSAASGSTQGGPTLFGSVSAAGGSTQGGSTGLNFFGNQPQAGGNVQGGSMAITLSGNQPQQQTSSNTQGGLTFNFGGLKPAAGTSGPTLFGAASGSTSSSNIFSGLGSNKQDGKNPSLVQPASGMAGPSLFGTQKPGAGSNQAGMPGPNMFGGATVAATGFRFSAGQPQQNAGGVSSIFNPQQSAGGVSQNSIFNPQQQPQLKLSQSNPLTGGLTQQSTFNFGGGASNTTTSKMFEFGSQPSGGSQPNIFQPGPSSGTSTPRKVVKARRKNKK